MTAASQLFPLLSSSITAPCLRMSGSIMPPKKARAGGRFTVSRTTDLLDVDLGRDLLAHRADVEVEPVAGPARADLGAARYMVGQLADVALDPAPRLLGAEFVGKVDGQGIAHGAPLAAPDARDQGFFACGAMGTVAALSCVAAENSSLRRGLP